MDTARLEQPATPQRGPVRRGTVVDCLPPPQKRRLSLQRTAVRQSLILSGGLKDSLWSAGVFAAPRAGEPFCAGLACCDVAVQTDEASAGVFDAAPGTWAPSPAFHWNECAEPFSPVADAAVYNDELPACELCADTPRDLKEEEDPKGELGIASFKRESLKERTEGFISRLDALLSLQRCGGLEEMSLELAAAAEECVAFRLQLDGARLVPVSDAFKPEVEPCVFMDPLVEEVSLCAEASGSGEEEDDEAADLEAHRERTQQLLEEAEVFRRLGNELYKKKKFEEALSIYDMAIQKEPHDFTYHNNRCAALMEMSVWKYETVISTCKALIAQQHVFNFINPGGASPEKVVKVLNRLVSAVTKLRPRELIRKGFAAWAVLTAG